MRMARRRGHRNHRLPIGEYAVALPQPLTVYLDESLKRYPVVYAAAGTPNSALPITFQELQEITAGIPCQVSEEADL